VVEQILVERARRLPVSVSVIATSGVAQLSAWMAVVFAEKASAARLI
jgi:hypothetical protein